MIVSSNRRQRLRVCNQGQQYPHGPLGRRFLVSQTLDSHIKDSQFLVSRALDSPPLDTQLPDRPPPDSKLLDPRLRRH